MEPPARRTCRSLLDDSRSIVALLVVYALVLTTLLDKLPLWLDELLQVLGTNGQSFAQILNWLPANNPGSGPISYLLQSAAFDVFGYSVSIARLPAALFSILGCLSLVWLCRELRLLWQAVAMILLMLLPLQLRYALEARCYSQAMCLSIVATVLAAKLWRRPGNILTLLYGLTLVAAAYTLPLLVLLPVAHILWAAVWLPREGKRPTVVRIALAGACACTLLAPWGLWARSGWNTAIAVSRFHFPLHPMLPLAVVRELAGGGYWASLPLLAAAVAGFAAGRIERPVKALLGVIILVQLLGTLAIDAAFDYFYAVRQSLPLLPFVILLASEGARMLFSRRRAAGVLVLGVLFAGFLVHDVRWFGSPKENWELAARTLKDFAPGDCLLLVPADVKPLYFFFAPELASRLCNETQMNSSHQAVVLVSNHYSLQAEVTAAEERLGHNGLSAQDERLVGGTRMRRYVR
jgi:4-amino-4-deoxy-L-arabinose transferase-like glycosyltransferase